jgi:catechol 2,3-dioxygenase-like lactoylglutathione lyase family enzyme
MLEKLPIVAFVATTKPDLARAFYAETLGLTLISDDPFALAFDAHGTMLRIQKVDSFSPQRFTVLGWQTSNLPATVRELTRRGVEFRRYPGMSQDEHGIWTSPSGARVAWFADPDGNTLSLSQPAS